MPILFIIAFLGFAAAPAAIIESQPDQYPTQVHSDAKPVDVKPIDNN